MKVYVPKLVVPPNISSLSDVVPNMLLFFQEIVKKMVPMS